MKKHLLFLPDIFFVSLIVLSCERVDLSAQRSARDYFQDQNPLALNNLDAEIDLEYGEAWTEMMADYKDRAVSIIHHLKEKVADQI